jgi:hypothetical protein
MAAAKPTDSARCTARSSARGSISSCEAWKPYRVTPPAFPAGADAPTRLHRWHSTPLECQQRPGP